MSIARHYAPGIPRIPSHNVAHLLHLILTPLTVDLPSHSPDCRAGLPNCMNPADRFTPELRRAHPFEKVLRRMRPKPHCIPCVAPARAVLKVPPCHTNLPLFVGCRYPSTLARASTGWDWVPWTTASFVRMALELSCGGVAGSRSGHNQNPTRANAIRVALCMLTRACHSRVKCVWRLTQPSSRCR